MFSVRIEKRRWCFVGYFLLNSNIYVNWSMEVDSVGKMFTHLQDLQFLLLAQEFF